MSLPVRPETMQQVAYTRRLIDRLKALHELRAKCIQAANLGVGWPFMINRDEFLRTLHANKIATGCLGIELLVMTRNITTTFSASEQMHMVNQLQDVGTVAWELIGAAVCREVEENARRAVQRISVRQEQEKLPARKVVMDDPVRMTVAGHPLIKPPPPPQRFQARLGAVEQRPSSSGQLSPSRVTISTPDIFSTIVMKQTPVQVSPAARRQTKRTSSSHSESSPQFVGIKKAKIRQKSSTRASQSKPTLTPTPTQGGGSVGRGTQGEEQPLTALTALEWRRFLEINEAAEHRHPQMKRMRRMIQNHLHTTLPPRATVSVFRAIGRSKVDYRKHGSKLRRRRIYQNVKAMKKKLMALTVEQLLAAEKESVQQQVMYASLPLELLGAGYDPYSMRDPFRMHLMYLCMSGGLAEDFVEEPELIYVDNDSDLQTAIIALGEALERTKINVLMADIEAVHVGGPRGHWMIDSRTEAEYRCFPHIKQVGKKGISCAVLLMLEAADGTAYVIDLRVFQSEEGYPYFPPLLDDFLQERHLIMVWLVGENDQGFLLQMYGEDLYKKYRMIDFRHIEPYAGNRTASRKATSRDGTVFLDRIGGRFWSEGTAETSKLQVLLNSVFKEATHEQGDWVEQDKCAFITQYTGHTQPQLLIGTMFAFLHRQSMHSVWGRKLLDYCRQDTRALWLGLYCYALFKPMPPPPAADDNDLYILRQELMAEIYRRITERRVAFLQDEKIDQILSLADLADNKETTTKLSEFAYGMAADMVDQLARFGNAPPLVQHWLSSFLRQWKNILYIIHSTGANGIEFQHRQKVRADIQHAFVHYFMKGPLAHETSERMSHILERLRAEGSLLDPESVEATAENEWKSGIKYSSLLDGSKFFSRTTNMILDLASIAAEQATQLQIAGQLIDKLCLDVDLANQRVESLYNWVRERAVESSGVAPDWEASEGGGIGPLTRVSQRDVSGTATFARLFPCVAQHLGERESSIQWEYANQADWRHGSTMRESLRKILKERALGQVAGPLRQTDQPGEELEDEIEREGDLDEDEMGDITEELYTGVSAF